MRKDKNVMCRVYIKEIPYQLYKYTVVRATEHEFWFYATYDKLDDAIKSAENIPNGYVLQTRSAEDDNK